MFFKLNQEHPGKRDRCRWTCVHRCKELKPVDMRIGENYLIFHTLPWTPSNNDNGDIRIAKKTSLPLLLWLLLLLCLAVVAVE